LVASDLPLIQIKDTVAGFKLCNLSIVGALSETQRTFSLQSGRFWVPHTPRAFVCVYAIGEMPRAFPINLLLSLLGLRFGASFVCVEFKR
jgi:hypothetical protein